MSAFDMFPDNEETAKLKTEFAVAILRFPEQAFKAGQEVFGADTGRALYVASNWIKDPFVESEKIRLVKEKGARSFLPTKEDYARTVWELANGDRTPIEDKRHLLALYGDIMGYKTQAEKAGINVNVTQNKVMVIRDHGTDADWERQAAAQQHRLTNGAIDVPSRTVQ
jgi:hypothetical protein